MDFPEFIASVIEDVADIFITSPKVALIVIVVIAVIVGTILILK